MGDKSDDCIQVVVRCRPFNRKEKDEGRNNIIDCECENRSISIRNDLGNKESKGFTFDGVYDENTQQKIFYEDCCFGLVENVLEGFNGTIFAYGQTGCGKSYTMQGPSNAGPDGRGVIPNAFSHIFESIKASQDVEYLIHCSYLEIYNEEIKDLLGDPKAKKPPKCDVKEDPGKGVFVKNLTTTMVKTEDELQKCLDRGLLLRTVAETKMNDESSRSHSIFTIVIEMSSMDTITGKELMKVGKLNLVDLAGSERQKKTGASGATLKEGAKINLSLSALGNVISTLADNKPGKHVPYRDSKLTRLLQDSLGGNTKTLMVAAISPADYNYDETSSTLRYANRAKNIQNKAKINEDPKDTMMRELRDQVEQLKQMLQAQASGGGGGSVAAIEKSPVKQNGVGDFDFSSMASANDNSEPSADLQKQNEEMENALKEERRKHEELMDRMKELQSKLVGHNTGNFSEQMQGDITPSENTFTDEQIEAARNLKERRLKAKRKRDAKKSKQLELAQLEKAAIEEELEDVRQSAQGLVGEVQQESDENKEEMRKRLVKMKRKYEKKIQAARAETDEIIEEASYQRQQLLDSLRETERDSRLYEAICQSVMSDKEIKKIIEKARYDEEEDYWVIPFTKRKSMPDEQLGAPVNYLIHNNTKNDFPGGKSGAAQLPGIRASSDSTAAPRRGSKDSLPSLQNGTAGSHDDYGEITFQGGNNFDYGGDMSSCGVLPNNVNNVASLPDNISGKGDEQDSYDYYVGDNGPNSIPPINGSASNNENSGKKLLTAEEKEIRAKKKAAKAKKKAKQLEQIKQQQQNQVYSDEAGAGETAGDTLGWDWANDARSDAQFGAENSEPENYDDDFDDEDDKPRAHPPINSNKPKQSKTPSQRKQKLALPAL